MGSNLSIIQTRDRAEIYEVLKHPDIWPLVSERKPSKNLIPVRPQDLYLIIKHKKRVIACVYFEVLNGYELEMHPYVLPKERKHHSERAVKAAMAWAFNQLIKRILVEIPDNFPHIKEFAKRLGFRQMTKNTFEMRSKEWADL